MKYICDFHIHSKYSRATARNTDVDNLVKWARIKGVDILGSGDFTHPQWLKELKEKLIPAEEGLFKYRERKPNNNNKEIRFILTTEISSIYAKGGKTRKVHNIIFAPSFDVVEKINTHLGWIGNLKSDGRPILGLDSRELAKIVLNISEDCLIVPAHCLLPDTYLHSNPGIKMIKDISVVDKIYTHKGRLRKVEKVYKRPYYGKIYNIKPYYFRLGLKTTSEHPFYIIKAYKDCKNCPHTVCKPDCAYYKTRGCSHPYFENYKLQWVQAKNVEKGDILVFPRFNNKVKDLKEIRLSNFINKKYYKLEKDKISALGGRARSLFNAVRINKEFCRLMGYYLAEGYTDNRDSISFCFNSREKKYVKDLKYIMEKIFGLSSPRVYKRKNTESIEIIYFSKILAKVFSQLFYNHSEIRRAHTKCLPSWMLELPLEKQKEILMGWWRGDKGSTSSRELMNQMKIIMLRLGIIPSIYEQTKDDFNKNYISVYKKENRIIKAQHSSFSLTRLSFFQDLFGLLKTPEFKKFNTKLKRRHGWIDDKYIYIPIRDIEISDYKGQVYNLEVKEDNSYVAEFAAVHNCWTPWFSLFGSNSGFDSVEECFEEYSKYIYALESGLSADPAMFWRLSALDNKTIISNSDAHSPQKLGREANIFEGKEINYNLIAKAIRDPNYPNEHPNDPNKLKLTKTIEFFPEEGKYHWDGHRNCELCLNPEESIKYNNICPRCGRPLTIGVMNRVRQLSDRKPGERPEKIIPFQRLIPLNEIIADVLGLGVGTKGVDNYYRTLVRTFGNEFKVLLDVKKQEIAAASLPEIAEGIERVRQGKILVAPGYDGEFGKISIFGDGEERPRVVGGQETLFK